MNINGLQYISAQQQQTLAKGLAVVIVAATIFALTLSAWSTIKTLEQAPQATTSTPVLAVKAIDTSVAQGLFGVAQQTQNLPSTQLELTLRGAFTATDPKRASAIIEAGTQAKTYRVGQTITSNTTLQAVQDDRVILARNGQLETLFFPDTTTVSKTSGAVESPSTAAAADSSKQAQIKRRLEELRARIRKNKGA